MQHVRLFLTPFQRKVCQAIADQGQEPRFVWDPEHPTYVELHSFLTGDTTIPAEAAAPHQDAPVTSSDDAEEKPIKLDRATRGQVRRATNRLMTVEKARFPSSSNPNRFYETVVYQDGKVLCNCQGWTMKKGDKPRQCKHTAELIADRPTREDGEFLYIDTPQFHRTASCHGIQSPQW